MLIHVRAEIASLAFNPQEKDAQPNIIQKKQTDLLNLSFEGFKGFVAF